MINKFSDILAAIASGLDFSLTELSPYLCTDSRKDRLEVNILLAQAFHSRNDLKQAENFIHRAWLLSNCSVRILPLYLKIHAHDSDLSSIQEAYKRIGMQFATNNNIEEALRYFSLSMYTYAEFQQIDHYKYDFDILEKIKNLAKPFHPPQKIPVSLAGRKTKLAYLLFGILNTGSVVIRICKMLALHHNKEIYDITFFTVETEHEILRSKEARQHLHEILQTGCNVVMAEEARSVDERLVVLASPLLISKPIS